MPPKPKLSIFEIQTLLQARIQNCALCGGHNWELEPDVSILRLGNPWMPRESRKITCVLLSCYDCGNTHIINVDRLAISLKEKGVQSDQTVTIAETDDDDLVDDVPYLMAEED